MIDINIFYKHIPVTLVQEQHGTVAEQCVYTCCMELAIPHRRNGLLYPEGHYLTGGRV